MRTVHDKCSYKKVDCFGFGVYGRCNVCSDTWFSGGECPFYKTKVQRESGHIQSIQRLRMLNREDLIDKYGYDGDQPKIWREI